jgi:hypothetical protein
MEKGSNFSCHIIPAQNAHFSFVTKKIKIKLKGKSRNEGTKWNYIELTAILFSCPTWRKECEREADICPCLWEVEKYD